MTITYHAGRRIQATQAEFDGVDSVTAGWKLLGRTSVTSGDTIDVSSFDSKRYLMVLGSGIGSGNVALISRFNSDTGNEYLNRYNSNGTGDTASNTATDRMFTNGAGSSPQEFAVFYIANKDDQEKIVITKNVNNPSTGSNNQVQRREAVSKWKNTSNAITTLNVFNSDTGDYASGSEVIVLGYDPSDTHTTNFWEQLADVELTGTNSVLDTSSFTAKKYLWVQAYVKQASTYSTGMQFNSDQNDNYSARYSGNGNSDNTALTDTWKCAFNYSSLAGGGYLINSFIQNIDGKEKLVMSDTVENKATGVNQPPNRCEIAGKWDITSGQITSVQIRKESGTGDLQSGSFIRVWGSD